MYLSQTLTDCEIQTILKFSIVKNMSNHSILSTSDTVIHFACVLTNAMMPVCLSTSKTKVLALPVTQVFMSQTAHHDTNQGYALCISHVSFVLIWYSWLHLNLIIQTAVTIRMLCLMLVFLKQIVNVSWTENCLFSYLIAFFSFKQKCQTFVGCSF